VSYELLCGRKEWQAEALLPHLPTRAKALAKGGDAMKTSRAGLNLIEYYEGYS
jgi:hypothetical protein